MDGVRNRGGLHPDYSLYPNTSFRGDYSIREKTSDYVSSKHGLLFCTILALVVAYSGIYLTNRLPEPVSEENSGAYTFSEHRAWKKLVLIVNDNPKVAGSKEHLNITLHLKAILNKISAKSAQTVNVDWQRVDGDFWLDFSYPYISSYSDLSNVVAIIEGRNRNASLLINCHYDSVPMSPGASDNGIWCAVMLEVLEILSKDPSKPQINIIFLFNGAEENSLQASHGFLNHPWAKTIKSFINLDSAGMGGKAVVFQSSDPRILCSYSSSVYLPQGQSIGEALFRSGLVPSDTDFRIFRDFGNLTGIDIAFYQYGHVYHTKYDALYLIKPGVIQHSGNTLLTLARNIGYSDIINGTIQPEPMVYWDYLSLFMISYSYTIEVIIDVFAVIISVLSIHLTISKFGYSKKVIKELLLYLVSRICCCASGLLACMLAAVVSHWVYPLRYYSRPWTIVFMYALPFIMASNFTSVSFDKQHLSNSGLHRRQRFMLSLCAMRVMLTTFLLYMLVFVNGVTTPIRYLFSLPLIHMSIIAIISIILIEKYNLTGTVQLYIHLFGNIPVLVFIYYVALTTFSLIIPILGRTGHNVKIPDIVVAVLCALFFILAGFVMSGIELLFKGSLKIFYGIGLILSVLVLFYPVLPYSGDLNLPAPQRYIIMHTSRLFYEYNGNLRKESSGYWFLNLDVNGPQTALNALNEIIDPSKIVNDLTEECNKELYCGFPMLTSRILSIVAQSTWYEADKPRQNIQSKTMFKLNGKSCQKQICNLQFIMIGPSHNSLILCPVHGVKLVKWSLNSPINSTNTHNNRPVYFIYHTWSTYNENQQPFKLNIQLEIVSNKTDKGPLIEIAFSALQTHHHELFTNNFKRILSKFPIWIHITPMIASYSFYIF